MEYQLFYPQPIQDLATGHLIKLTHERLEISKNFEMTQTVRLEFYTNDEGQFGIPVLESIRLNPNLTDDQKARLSKAFQPVTRTSSTEGVMINPETLEVVLPDNDGNFPPNSVPEKNSLAQYPSFRSTGRQDIHQRSDRNNGSKRRMDRDCNRCNHSRFAGKHIHQYLCIWRNI